MLTAGMIQYIQSFECTNKKGREGRKRDGKPKGNKRKKMKKRNPPRKLRPVMTTRTLLVGTIVD